MLVQNAVHEASRNEQPFGVIQGYQVAMEEVRTALDTIYGEVRSAGNSSLLSEEEVIIKVYRKLFDHNDE